MSKVIALLTLSPFVSLLGIIAEPVGRMVEGVRAKADARRRRVEGFRELERLGPSLRADIGLSPHEGERR